MISRPAVLIYSRFVRNQVNFEENPTQYPRIMSNSHPVLTCSLDSMNICSKQDDSL